MNQEITPINSTYREHPHERIPQIQGQAGAANVNGRSTLSQEEAITGIENRKGTFQVRHGGKMEVIFAVSRYVTEYLKAEADVEQPGNLLSLPDCR